MAPTRPSTPPPRSRASTMEFGHPPLGPPPSTPGPRNNHRNNSSASLILGSDHAIVPPSPSVPVPDISMLTMNSSPTFVSPAPSARAALHKKNALTGAGVKKQQIRKKPDGSLAKLAETAFAEKPVLSDKAIEQPFRFMDLPGELRNEIYKHTYDRPKQALLVHRPRLASLRPRTRLDRSRTLASDIADQEHDEELSTKRHGSLKPKPKGTPRNTNRPFYGLTQVCRQIRHEFRQIYLAKQEMGMDLTEIVVYLQTFYAPAAGQLANLAAPGDREADLSFVGNLTIAVGEKPNDLEKSDDGVDVFPLLDIWANSFKIEAGFGRYLKVHYVPETDGEAKDLYRLFGRRVLRNRSCSAMNNLWRTVLRNRVLASVCIHRKPAPPVALPVPSSRIPRTAGVQVAVGTPTTKPYIHIIFKQDCAEPWMTKFESVVPKNPVDWLAERGFGAMEYFDVRVGVERIPASEEMDI